MAPPGEYDKTICAWQRCRLLPNDYGHLLPPPLCKAHAAVFSLSGGGSYSVFHPQGRLAAPIGVSSISHFTPITIGFEPNAAQIKLEKQLKLTFE